MVWFFVTGIGLLILIRQIPVALGVAAEGDDAIAKLIDAALDNEAKSVQAPDLTRVPAMDATGLSMVAEVTDRHPHLKVWVASVEKTPALQGAGIPEDRIHILGYKLVRLRNVLVTIQSADPTELAAASAESR